MKKSFSLATALVFGIALFAASSQAAPGQAAKDQAGFQLLERLVVLLVKAGAPGGGGGGDAGQDIVALAKEMKAAQAAKQVDDIFAVRYSRLLSAVRQAVTMDPEVLYWPMYRFSMFDFIEEKTGQMPDWKRLLFIVNDHGGAGVGLGFIADAVMSEIVSLHIHLETLAQRPEILKAYLDKGMKAAVPGKSPK